MTAILCLTVFVLVFVFVIVPAVFHYNKTIQRHMIFLPWGKGRNFVNVFRMF